MNNDVIVAKTRFFGGNDFFFSFIFDGGGFVVRKLFKLAQPLLDLGLEAGVLGDEAGEPGRDGLQGEIWNRK